MATGNGRGWSPAIPARYIAQVIKKLADGTYPIEPIRCICGADFDDMVVVERDRFSIPHRMVMCNKCALLRANPRMTAESYAKFYNDEYRPIYDGWEFGKHVDNDEARFMVGADVGMIFREFIKYFGIAPKVALDIGCNMGSMLLPLQDDGTTIYGIEINDHAVAYGRKMNIPIFRSLAEARSLGIKPDLVSMMDFIEHLMDFDILDDIQGILAEGGYLYVGTPGLFHPALGTMFQNAHTYQFIGETLNYLMTQHGWEAIYIDERIDSLWQYVGKPEKEPIPPGHWKKYILEHLHQVEKRSIPPQRTIINQTVGERKDNIERNLSHKYPDIRELKGKYSGPVVVIGGGPSVDVEVDKIKELAARYPVVVIERMYPWCHEIGITPQFVVSLDGKDGVQAGFTHIQDETCHLLGSTTHSSVGDMLVGKSVYIFNVGDPGKMSVQDLWYKYGYETMTVINTGGSVTLCCLYLMMHLGFRNFHMFGFDCMVGKRSYASGIAGESVDRKYFQVEIDGESYITCASFISFAQQFFRMVEMARRARMIESIDVYGESLVNKMARVKFMAETPNEGLDQRGQEGQAAGGGMPPPSA